MVPLIVAPVGGKIGVEAGTPLDVQRTYLTARSVEFDAILVAGPCPPAPDAMVPMDAKAGEPTTGTDPRVVLLLGEAYRHDKAVGGWGASTDVLAAAGCADNAPGVVAAPGGADAVAAAVRLLATHRVWERHPVA
jgi:catalase